MFFDESEARLRKEGGPTVCRAEVARLRRDLSLLADHVNGIREEESRRIAGEIHDDLGQALTAIKFHLSRVQRALPPECELLLQELCSASRLLDEMMNDLRRIALNLRPGLIEGRGLKQVIIDYSEAFQRRTGIQVLVNLGDNEFPPGDDWPGAVFRIIQEAMTNVARHAEATRVLISVHFREGNLFLEVSDNGKGIDLTGLCDGLGLIGMRERARRQGGDPVVSNLKGRGMRVSARIPLSGGRASKSEGTQLTAGGCTFSLSPEITTNGAQK